MLNHMYVDSCLKKFVEISQCVFGVCLLFYVVTLDFIYRGSMRFYIIHLFFSILPSFQYNIYFTFISILFFGYVYVSIGYGFFRVFKTGMLWCI